MTNLKSEIPILKSEDIPMPRLLFAAVVLLGLSASASAQQTVSAIIPITEGQTVAGGFRDIPPGPCLFQITLQSNSGGIAGTNVMSSNGQVTWMPQSNTSGATTHVWATTAPQTEATIGTVSGYGMFMDFYTDPSNAQQANFYTTNAFWADICQSSGGYTSDCYPGMQGSTYLDPGVGVWSLVDTLPDYYVTGGSADFDLPSLTVSDGQQDGYLWFTSDTSGVAVYWLAPGAATSVMANQPQLIQGGSSGFPPGRFQAHADETFSGQAIVTVHYRSVNSINPSGDGDSLDLIYVIRQDALNDAP
jgi:hypothetical protein